MSKIPDLDYEKYRKMDTSDTMLAAADAIIVGMQIISDQLEELNEGTATVAHNVFYK